MFLHVRKLILTRQTSQSSFHMFHAQFTSDLHTYLVKQM